jgi:predicted dinucleotide-binding enzyme
MSGSTDLLTAPIGLVGAGLIGGTLARLFAANGHDVEVANSRGPETLADLVAELGGRGRAVTAAEALRFGPAAVVSIPLGRIDELPTDLADGTIVIDTNNYYPSRDGQIAALDDDSTTSSELLQRLLPNARVVKAFNAINWRNLGERGTPPGDPARLAIPISGDDADAKAAVAALIDQIGFDAVDNGTLADSRRHQPGTPVYGAQVGADEARRLLGIS